MFTKLIRGGEMRSPADRIRETQRALKCAQELNAFWRESGLGAEISLEELKVWVAVLFYNTDQNEEGEPVRLWIVQREEGGKFIVVPKTLGELRAQIASEWDRKDWYELSPEQQKKAVREELLPVLYATQAVDGNAWGKNCETIYRLNHIHNWLSLWREVFSG